MPICTCPKCKLIDRNGLSVTKMVKFHHQQDARLKAQEERSSISISSSGILADGSMSRSVESIQNEQLEDRTNVDVESSPLGASTSTGFAYNSSINGDVIQPDPPTTSDPSAALRRSSRPRKPRARGEVISLVERRRREQEAVESNEKDDVDESRLGLYDDPDDLDVVQRVLTEPEPLPLPPSTPPSVPSLDHQINPEIILSAVDPYPPKRPATEIFKESHDHFFVRILFIIVAYLHIHHNVSFRACSALLACLNSLLLFLCLLPPDDLSQHIPINFATIVKRLDLGDRFRTYPVCSSCHQLFRNHIPVNSRCLKCNTALFNPPSRQLFQRLTRRKPPPPPPICAAPIQSLSSQLQDFLAQDGMEDAVELWRSRSVSGDTYTDVMDGEVWRTIKGHDGRPFFDLPEDTTELRLGVTIGLDWFGRKSSVYGPSHSSGAISFCVSNLPIELRYRVQNLLIVVMTPGPREPTAEELQCYMKLVVDDLLYLYMSGHRINTAAYPEGRTVRVALIAVVCDHPALCKLGGFADHAHKLFPCTKCTVPTDMLYSDKSLSNEFLARDAADFRNKCYSWLAKSSPKDRDSFFKDNGVRWTELARLDYFDIVRCSVVDPMHNLLLGVVKNQWYSRWIACGTIRASSATQARELDVIHSFLETLESPLWLGTLPYRVGEPAGGSLTADEYKLVALVALPLIIPIVWDRFYDSAISDHAKAQETYDNAVQEQQLNVESSALALPKKPDRPRMHADEAINFLRLSTSLKIFLGSSVQLSQLTRAEELLRSYLLNYRKIYPDKSMKPNHHWSVHLAEQIRDFGPVYSFWTFLGERLNKTLKSFNSNNWSGGQMEISMMRYFSREVQLQSLMRAISSEVTVPDDASSSHLISSIAKRLICNESEANGTIQDAATSLFFSGKVKLGRATGRLATVSDAVRAALHHFYNSSGVLRVHYPLDQPSTLSFLLRSQAQFYQYALLFGRRITPTSRSLRKSLGSSIILALWNNCHWAGEVRNIFQHSQPGYTGGPIIFAEMEWMVPLSDGLPMTDVWEDFPELGVQMWEYKKYHQSQDGGPPLVIPFGIIQCQLARGLISCWDPSVWITITLKQLPIDLSDELTNINSGDNADER